MEAQEEAALLAWDECVLGKSKSIAIEGLSAVRSSKARRLKRIKPGYFNPPGGRPVFVPGMHWVTLLLTSRKWKPCVVAMLWWTTRGKFASGRRTEEAALLKRCAQAWGRRVLHIWDRGISGAPWLAQASAYPVRFVLRWQKGYKLIDNQERNRKAWEITRGKRSWRRTGHGGRVGRRQQPFCFRPLPRRRLGRRQPLLLSLQHLYSAGDDLCGRPGRDGGTDGG
jgi:hypothetical protein